MRSPLCTAAATAGCSRTRSKSQGEAAAIGQAICETSPLFACRTRPRATLPGHVHDVQRSWIGQTLKLMVTSHIQREVKCRYLTVLDGTFYTNTSLKGAANGIHQSSGNMTIRRKIRLSRFCVFSSTCAVLSKHMPCQQSQQSQSSSPIGCLTQGDHRRHILIALLQCLRTCFKKHYLAKYS